MKTIFVVDDNQTNLVAAQNALDGIYRVITLNSALKMFKIIEKIKPDLILLDIDMPEMDGFEAIGILKNNEKFADIPVIFLTANGDAETEAKCLSLGCVDFCNKPFSAAVLQKRIKLHIETERLISEAQTNLRNIQNAMLYVIADMVESRDKVTGGHIERTQLYIEILIDALIEKKVYNEEISKWNMEMLLPSAQLHDIGKISIPDSILNKPGRLEDWEFKIIQSHAIEGERLINEIMSRTKDNGFLVHAKMFAGYHHEKWNGTGYPHKLAGGGIPLQGRILAIADVYDALVSERPYKKPFSHDEAVEIIKKDSGTHFDPNIVDVFMTIADKFYDEKIRIAEMSHHEFAKTA